jgi:transglutaminase-like putative cysteine protease
MKRIRIIHNTQYHYRQPVTFGPHRAMLRPREGHDVHIVKSRLDIGPPATLRWLRDIYGNSIVVIDFQEAGKTLSILSEVDVDLYADNPIECLIEPTARLFPFHYAPDEQIELIPYRLTSYPYDTPALQAWLNDLHHPGQVLATFDLLNNLNSHIYRSLKYAHREEAGVQLPHDTLALGGGSCRDFAVLMMEAARYWGFGARFVIRVHPDGRGPARRHACLDRNLHPRRGLARLRSYQQQACRQRAYFRCGGPRAGQSLSAVGLLGGGCECLRAHGGIGAGRACRCITPELNQKSW